MVVIRREEGGRREGERERGKNLYSTPLQIKSDQSQSECNRGEIEVPIADS